MASKTKRASELTPQEWRKIRKIADVHSAKTSTGADIYLICPKTKIGPEALAMIQSLYSRDPASILYHLIEVSTKGPEAFMEQFYKGYNHKSIGDCGNILLAFEGISMLAAKAIQDTQQYDGQEASTRYMDFSDQVFLAPEKSSHLKILASSPGQLDPTQAQSIQERWRQFYLKNLPIAHEYLMEQNPHDSFDYSELLAEKPDLNTKLHWKKTLKARAFDQVRAFLPAGACTYVAWWTSISHADEHLSWLRCHVLSEVSEIALATEELLKKVYPSSFGRTIHSNREDYKKKWYNNEYYLEVDARFADFDCKAHHYMMLTEAYKEMVLTRPQGVSLPWQIGEAINVVWTDLIDFGSWRDQQRHRAVVQRMGLITAQYGFHEWYFENLPPAVAEEARALVDEQLAEIESLGLLKFDTQYLFPMGMKVPTRTQGSLSKIMYLIEIRCRGTVHPTLHANAYKLAKSLRSQLADIFNCSEELIPMYIDENVGALSLKRGSQDITRKEVV